MDQRAPGDRKAVGLLVKLKHTDVDSFTEEYATNLSPGGMFIRSRQPQPVGSLVNFEIQIANGQRVMRGRAQVKWIREQGDPAGPPGMGLQFLAMDATTRALVDRMLASNPRTGVHRMPTAPKVSNPLASPLMPKPAAPAPVKTAAQKAAAEAAAAAELAALGLAPPSKPSSKPSGPDRAAAEAAAAAELAALGLAEETPDDRDGVSIDLDDLVNETPPSPAAEIPLELELETGSAAAEEEIEIPVEPPPPPKPPPPAQKAAPPAAKPPPAPVAKPPQKAETGLPEIQRAPRAPEPPQGAPVMLKQGPAAPAPVARASAETVFLKPPAKIEGVGPVIGIDLGTTNSCVAILRNNKPAVITSKDGYNTIPSIVSLSAKGEPLVGHRAKGQLILNPKNTVIGAKRLVGRPYDSPVVRQVREHFHYTVCGDASGRAAVQLGANVLSLEEVQGIILREAKEMASQYLGKPVERAVVTCPAYYSEPQREAVRKAGALAGLKVERILNEPTAAALAYGLNRELNKKILVYDLGGGTFDATVMKIEKNVFEVLATGGDTFLGGVDFDNAIVGLLLERFQQTSGIAFEGDSVALSRVTDVAENMKVALSERNTYDVHVPMLMMAGGKPYDLRCTVTRDELNRTCEDLVVRSVDVVRDVLLDAGLKPGDIDDVILVGGMSRMPLVREHVKNFFGRPPQASVHADEAVALGAALYSGSIDKVSSVVLIDVLPMTIGVGMPGGVFQRVIERNSPLPAQRSFALTTKKDNETSIEISVFQGEDNHVSGNEYLGTVTVDGLPKAPKGAVKVAVTLRLDSECVIHVEAKDLATRKEVKANLATRYSPDQLQQQLGYTAEQKKAAEDRQGKALEQRSGGFWKLVKKVLGRK